MNDSTFTQILLLVIAMQANVPVILWGSPGEAKSAIIAQIFQVLGWPFKIILGSNMDPTDIGGWPFDGGDVGVQRKAPSWAVALSKRIIGDKPAGLFFEEVNNSPKAVQNAMMRVVHESVVGDEELGPNVVRIAAANPIEESAGGWHLDAPFANRFFHIDWTLSVQYWVDALIAGFPPPDVPRLPKTWEAHIPPSNALVAAYLMSNPTAYKDIPKDESKASKAFPTARSWTMAARLLAAGTAMSVDDGVKLRLVTGCVGQGAALGFMRYIKDLDLPKPQEMLANPKKIKWPKRGDQMYAALTSLVSYVIHDGKAKTWEKAWDVLEIASGNHKDVAAACARVLAAEKNTPRGAQPPTSIEAFFPVFLAAGLVKNV
jgi:hypothetical protein